MEEDAQDRVCVCGVGGAWKFMLSEPRFPQTCMCLCRPCLGVFMEDSSLKHN